MSKKKVGAAIIVCELKRAIIRYVVTVTAAVMQGSKPSQRLFGSQSFDKPWCKSSKTMQFASPINPGQLWHTVDVHCYAFFRSTISSPGQSWAAPWNVVALLFISLTNASPIKSLLFFAKSNCSLQVGQWNLPSALFLLLLGMQWSSELTNVD